MTKQTKNMRGKKQKTMRKEARIIKWATVNERTLSIYNVYLPRIKEEIETYIKENERHEKAIEFLLSLVSPDTDPHQRIEDKEMKIYASADNVIDAEDNIKAQIERISNLIDEMRLETFKRQ